MLKFSKGRAKECLVSASWLLAEGMIFLLLAVATTRPLLNSWKVAIPLATEPVATVPLFNLWTLGWNINRLEAGLRGYWDAPIFAPAEDAFAFSEPQPLMMLMAPVVWCGGSLAMAYNLYLWLGLALTGLVTSRLVWGLTRSWYAAWTGGAMMVLLPYVHWQLGVVQLVPMFGVVWTIHALWKFGESPSILRSLLLGTAFAVTYFLCNYYGLFLSLLLILSGGWLLGKNLCIWRTWLKLFPGAAWCLLWIGPMILHQRHVAKQHDWIRPPDLIQQQSAKWGDFTATPWPQLLPIREIVSDQRSGWTLSPGYLKMGLAAFGLVWGLYVASLRRMTLFLFTFIVMGLLLAMGPNFQVRDWVPYDWLRAHYPGLSMARNVFRFVVFAQVGVVLLAALGLDGLSRRPLFVLFNLGQLIWQSLKVPIWLLLNKRTKLGNSLESRADGDEAAESMSSRFEPRFEKPFVLLMGLSFLAIIEVWPAPQKLYYPPTIGEEYGWLDWIKENTEPDDVLACIPFANGINVEHYLGTTEWMYYGLQHGRPIANGYSGFFPEPALVLKESMAAFPDEKSLQLLERTGVRYCVVYWGTFERQAIEDRPLASKKLQWQFTDYEAEVDIYRFLSESQ